MTVNILMPQLGESVTEGTINKWLVKVGDHVNKYDLLAEVTTDKVNAEIPSTVSGRVSEIFVYEGDTVEVGRLIAKIEATEERDQAVPEVKPATEANGASPLTISGGEAVEMKRRYSPAVLHLAQQHEIDLTTLSGSGAHGRITRKDVLQAIKEKQQESQTKMSAPNRPSAEKASPAYRMEGADQVIPISSVRQAIADKMVLSKHEKPHAWMMIEADVSNLVALRNQLKKDFERAENIPLTFLPFFIKAIVEALKEFPLLNSVWTDDGIVIKNEINISLAVATEEALYVPVIKNAAEKSVFGLAKAIDDLAKRTRAGKLTADDMSGGTFTINNTGSFGSILSMPIINYPQAAIITVESIVKRPVVIDDMIAIRSMVNLCLSLDHRILDGLVCGRFMQRVKQLLESYGPHTNIY